MPDKKFPFELSGQTLRPVRRRTCHRDPCPRTAPSLDLFYPTGVARPVRAGARPAGTAVPNRLCVDIEKLSGPARQTRCATRLRPFPPDVRSLRRQFQPALPWACHRWRFLRRWAISAPPFAGRFGGDASFPVLLVRLHQAERLSENFMHNLLSWVHPGFSVYAGPPVDAAQIVSLETQAR